MVRVQFLAADVALDTYLPLAEDKLAGLHSDGTGDIISEPIGRKALLHELEAGVLAYTPRSWCASHTRVPVVRSRDEARVSRARLQR